MLWFSLMYQQLPACDIGNAPWPSWTDRPLTLARQSRNAVVHDAAIACSNAYGVGTHSMFVAQAPTALLRSLGSTGHS